MRKGTLLVEDDPAALMSAYQTSILEEAVLEICRKDRINRKKSFEADSQANNVTTAGSRRSSKNELQSIKVPTDKDDIKVNKWLNKDNQQVVPRKLIRLAFIFWIIYFLQVHRFVFIPVTCINKQM